MRVDINFIHKELPQSDKDLFFGPLEEGDQFITLQDNWLLAHVMFEAGIFKSISQARKSGWNKPVPQGFSEYVVGKLKHKVTILNLWDGWNEKD